MKTAWILSVWALLMFIPHKPQPTQANDIAAKLQKFTEQFPIEKVFIHNDRDYYGPNEIIWLKSYLVAGSLHTPSPISNNVHVELIAPDKSLKQHIMLYSDRGFASGHIRIPDQVPSGTYLLRAYTSWMRNFDESYFFEKEIEIISGTNQSKVTPKPDPSIQFFPEGGKLVEQVPTRMAFMASNIEEPLLELFDENNASMGKVEVAHDGMGLFALTPQTGSNYYLKDAQGNQYDLPKAETTGFSISASPNLAEVVKITLRANPNTENKSELKAIVHSRGLISFAIDIDLSKNISFLNLPKNQMPEGISHITLFDNKDRPILERLVFVKKDRLDAQISTNNESYQPRSLVKTKIKVTDATGQPVNGSFSMAALDMNLVPTARPTKTIETELLLDSDLRGQVNNPSYYFSNDPKANQHLDLLMMTKGWRKFLWDDVLEESYPEINYLIEKGFNIEGKIVDKFNGKPIPKGKITYFDNSMVPPLIDETEADGDGNFSINNIIVYNNSAVTFQGANKKGRGQAIIGFQIKDTTLYQKPNTWTGPAVYDKAEEDILAFVDKSKERLLIDAAFDFDTTATRLYDVVVIGEKASISQEESAYGAGSVTFTYDKVSTGSKLGRSPLEIIQGRVAGVQITGMGLGISVTIRGGVSGFSGGAPPAFFLNDVPTDLETILGLSSANIERVEIFKGPDAAAFGSIGGAGVMAFYTYKGGGTTKPTEGMYSKIIKNAYQGPMAFYAPTYEEQLPEHVKPDRRVLVHWEPMIETDENGEAEIEFWTTDNATTLQLDLQGLSNKGKPVSSIQTIEVQKD